MDLSKEKILLVEDDSSVVRYLELELLHEGYNLVTEYDGRAGLEKAISEDFDLILLDVMIPNLNGMEVLRRLRQEKSTPVIMVTAKGDVTDKVMGLDLGADDYITKPFLIEELLARIRATLRRKQTHENDNKLITLGNLIINKNARTVEYAGKQITLTKTEYELLLFLINNKDIVLSRDKIIEHVWGYDFHGDTNVVDVFIKTLRKKLEENGAKKIIHTIRGVGYTIKNEK